MTKYEIWLLGYNKDYEANDYEKYVRTYKTLKNAQKYFKKLCENPSESIVVKDKDTFYVHAFLEEVFFYEEEDYSECLDVLDEQCVWRKE